MSDLFKDRQSVYPNRYKITTADGQAYFVTLERADEPTVQGTPLNANTLNQLLLKSGGTISGSLTIEEQLILKEALNLTESLVLTKGVHYGEGNLPAAGNVGRIYFKKVET